MDHVRDAHNSGISNDVILFSEVGLSLVHHYRVHRKGLPHSAFRGRYLVNTALSTAGGPSGAACSPVPSTADQTDVLGATPRPPDLEDELPSPDTSPVFTGHGVALLPAQVEEEVDLAQVLADFGTLPAIVTPMRDPQEERVVPPAECRAPHGRQCRAPMLRSHRRGRWAVRRCV